MFDWIPTFAGWAYFVLVVAMVVVVLLRRREASSALGWSLAIVFLPAIGIVLFLLFGINRVPRRLRHKIAHHAGFKGRLEYPVTGEEEPKAIRTREDRWHDVARMLESLEDAPRRTGNAVTLYEEGAHAFRDMGRAIAAATHHVHVEFYIFRNDELGRHLTDLLVSKCEEGVEVRVLVDAVGSAGNRHIVKRIRGVGGEAARFLPVRPFGKRITPNLRNHRKTVICDGCSAFFGGLNVGVEYLGRRARGREWYDLHVQVKGPAVWDVQRIFAEDWDFCTEAFLEGPAYFPAFEPAGDAPVQIVSGGPDSGVNAIRQAYFAAFVRARERIVVLTPYLVPDLSLRDALMSAARSDVDVHIVVQAPPTDNRLAHWCGEYYAEELIEAGIRIHGYTPGMMHAKAMTVDGEWGMIGTANLDNRSLHLNFEQMAVLDGPKQVAELEAALKGVVARSTEVTLASLRERSLLRRALPAGARLLAPLL